MIETSHLKRGTAAYRRATLALFCAGFATFALLYCIQPLLPLLAAHFAVSAANSSLALSLTTLSLALCLLISGALAESWGASRSWLQRSGWRACSAGMRAGGVPGICCCYCARCWAWR